MVTKDLGMVTAYAYAVAGGYTGTEAEFTQLMADLAVVVDDFDNFSVNVTTLPAGSSATASYADGVLSLGIPKGGKGDKGDKGDPGDVSQAQLDAAVSDLKSDINKIGNADLSYLSLNNNKKYISYTDVETNNNYLSHTDYIEIPTGAIQIQCGNHFEVSGSNYRVNPNILFYDENKALLRYEVNANDNIATYPIYNNAKYIRVNQPARGVTGNSLIKFVFDNKSGYEGSATVTFTSTASIINTPIQLEADVPYTIICDTEFNNGTVNVLINGDASHYVKFYNKGTVEFTPDITGYLTLFNQGGTVTGNITVRVYKSDDLYAKKHRTPTIYTVGQNHHTYSSLTALLLSLKNDDSEKIIYVESGDYDIYQEYDDLGLLDGDAPVNPTTDYFDYNVWVPANTHIIGQGIVRLIWNPSTSDISANWSKTISPLNVAGTATIENIEIHCTNGRYCIHDDPNGKTQFARARKIYKNVKCYKYANDSGYGSLSVIGFGIDREMYYEFDNCYFYSEVNGSAFYMHNRASDTLGNIILTNSSNVVVRHCIMDTSGNGVRLCNSASTSSQRIRVDFDSCYIGGQLLLSDTSDQSTGNQQNVYDVTLLHCNNPSIVVRDATNPYPVKIY